MVQPKKRIWFHRTRRRGERPLCPQTEVEGEIHDGDKVEFDVGETEKGPNAVKVKRVE